MVFSVTDQLLNYDFFLDCYDDDLIFVTVIVLCHSFVAFPPLVLVVVAPLLEFD